MPGLMDTARQLASRPYIAIVILDETTDGDPIYIATNPEIEGLIVQGETVEEARRNLDETRVEFILDLLEDGLDIPEPRKIHGTSIPGSIDRLVILPPEESALVFFNTVPAPPPCQGSESRWLYAQPQSP